MADRLLHCPRRAPSGERRHLSLSLPLPLSSLVRRPSSARFRAPRVALYSFLASFGHKPIIWSPSFSCPVPRRACVPKTLLPPQPHRHCERESVGVCWSLVESVRVCWLARVRKRRKDARLYVAGPSAVGHVLPGAVCLCPCPVPCACALYRAPCAGCSSMHYGSAAHRRHRQPAGRPCLCTALRALFATAGCRFVATRPLSPAARQDDGCTSRAPRSRDVEDLRSSSRAALNNPQEPQGRRRSRPLK